MNKVDEKADELSALRLAELSEIAEKGGKYTLADAIREGAQVTEHTIGEFGDGARACALTNAVVAGRSRKLV